MPGFYFLKQSFKSATGFVVNNNPFKIMSTRIFETFNWMDVYLKHIESRLFAPNSEAYMH